MCGDDLAHPAGGKGGPHMRTPIAVTFDTNTYSTIADPKISRLLEKWWPLNRDRWESKKRRLAWWYIQRCIHKGRIRAGIPEAASGSCTARASDMARCRRSVRPIGRPTIVIPSAIGRSA